MFVQHCVKGVADNGSIDVSEVFRSGLHCNRLRNFGSIRRRDIPSYLTSSLLDIHVNRYDDIDPTTNEPFSRRTAFLSLAAGAVERENVLATNVAHSAHNTALAFATRGGATAGYLFFCWVIVGLNSAVAVESVAEEVRELNNPYRSWSQYQLEGEVTAKLWVPGTQIKSCERYEIRDGMVVLDDVWPNASYQEPTPILNLRNWF